MDTTSGAEEAPTLTARGKPRKTVRWRETKDLHQYHYFELLEDERGRASTGNPLGIPESPGNPRITWGSQNPLGNLELM